MKRFLVFFAVVFFPLQASHAQMVVADAAVAGLLEWTHAEKLIQYGQMIENGIESISHLKDQIEKTKQQIEMAAQNMKSAKDIKSWDDFMNWYNRQLYMERMAVETAKGMNVSIGKKNYSIYDLEGIADGLTDTYIDYWDKEFTEEQRREMWLGLGLSPANYAYVQPYRIKGKEIARQLLTASEIQNDKNIKDSDRAKEIMDMLAKNASLPPEEQMGQNEILQLQLELSIMTSEKLSDISSLIAKQMEDQAINHYLNQPLPQSPQLTSWPEEGFKKLGK
jgi:hypothetical protein